MTVPDRIGSAGEIKGRGSRSCLHVASLVIKLKRGWGCVCEGGGGAEDEDGSCCSPFFFFLVVDCGGGQSSSARGRET